MQCTPNNTSLPSVCLHQYSPQPVLEKKIKKFREDLNREIANKEFTMRMDNDRKRAQAELQAAQLRIRLEKERAIELLEGEEGASAVAKRNIAEFIAVNEFIYFKLLRYQLSIFCLL